MLDSGWRALPHEQGDTSVCRALDRRAPDYNPIEKLWKQLKQEDTRLVDFPTFEALREKVETALLRFARRAADILSLCELPTELARAA